MTDFCLMLGWVCYLYTWFENICYYKRHNYYMPTIYILAGIVNVMICACFVMAFMEQ